MEVNMKVLAVIILALVMVAVMVLIILIPHRGNLNKTWVGWKYVSIEQEVTQKSVLNDTYFVSTNVWVRTWYGDAISLEWWVTDVSTKDHIEWTKGMQFLKAEAVYEKVISKMREK
jgi:carboxypeptidase C (cathepsin A)